MLAETERPSHTLRRLCRFIQLSVKGRGKGPNRRLWGIEQNEARSTYLGHYYGVDNVDHMVKNAKIRYTTWKYWHAPVLHALSIAVVTAYDMYMNVARGGFIRSGSSRRRIGRPFEIFGSNCLVKCWPTIQKIRILQKQTIQKRVLFATHLARLMIFFGHGRTIAILADQGQTNISNFSFLLETDYDRCSVTRSHGSHFYIGSHFISRRWFQLQNTDNTSRPRIDQQTIF